MWVGVGVPPWPSLAGLDGEWKGGVEGEGRGGRGNDHSGPLPPPSLFCGLGLRGGGVPPWRGGCSSGEFNHPAKKPRPPPAVVREEGP